MGKPFVKGDPRIYRKGRPPRAETARQIFRELGNEETEYKGVKMPKHKAVMLSIIEGAIGGDVHDKRLYMEYLYGKPAQRVELDAAVDVIDRSPERDALLLETFGGSDSATNEEG